MVIGIRIWGFRLEGSVMFPCYVGLDFGVWVCEVLGSTSFGL